MRRWMLGIALDADKEQPLFLQLARAVGDDIREGKLKPGDALPSSRELALCLGVNRNTVVAGYQELESEGLVRTRVGGGTFVAQHLLRVSASNVTNFQAPTYSFPTLRPCAVRHAPTRPNMRMLCSGIPDARLFPVRALSRAFRRAIENHRRAPLANTDSRGHLRLRTELATMLARTRGLAATPDNTMITRSIEQAIDLVARTLIAPGDVVAVEAFGYPPAWNVLKLAGARIVPLPLDAEGLDIDALEILLQRQHLRAVLVTPHHQFPTTAVMSQRRRARLAELSVRHRFAIIEDDYDHEFHYRGKPVLPIAAGAAGANVIYGGSLANLLAPGVATGFLVAPPVVFDHIAQLRACSDSRSDAAMECAIAELFEDGELLRHTLRMRRKYASRRDALADALHRNLGSALNFDVPHGGMAIWAHASPDIDVNAWSIAGEREGVMFNAATSFDYFQRDRDHLRLAFSYHDESELLDATFRMARALASVRPACATRIAKSPQPAAHCAVP